LISDLSYYIPYGKTRISRDGMAERRKRIVEAPKRHPSNASVCQFADRRRWGK
jgi:hypothetical protein